MSGGVRWGVRPYILYTKFSESFAILLLANFQKTFYREDYRLLERNKKPALPAKQKALNFFTN